MPGRGRGGYSQRRQWDWFGVVGNSVIDDTDFLAIKLVDVNNPVGLGDGDSRFLDATLMRAIGFVNVDPDFGATTGSQIMHTCVALQFSQGRTPVGPLFDPTVGTVNELSSDGILWFAGAAQSRSVTQDTAVGSREYAVVHPPLNCDVESARKMNDSGQIWLIAENLGGSGSISGFISFAFRFGFKLH